MFSNSCDELSFILYVYLSFLTSSCARFLCLFFVSSPNFVFVKTPIKPVKVSQGSTYSELLSVIEEMSREIRPTYAGSKSAMERLKRGRFQLLKGGFLARMESCMSVWYTQYVCVCVVLCERRKKRANQIHMNLNAQ